MDNAREDQLDNIFDRISDTRGRRDAAARNCVEVLLAGDMNSALSYARRSVEAGRDLEALYAEMNELHPKPV